MASVSSIFFGGHLLNDSKSVARKTRSSRAGIISYHTKLSLQKSAAVITQPTKIASTTPISTPANLADSSGDTTSAKPSWTHLPLYDDPTNEATQYYESDPSMANANLIERMGQVPVAEWFGDWDTDIVSSVNDYVTAAAAANAVPVLVMYNIPDRDCGGNSTGGAANATTYTQWIQQVSSAIDNRLAVIILEPDALGDVGCLATADQPSRFAAMAQAVTILKTDPNLTLYIDAGNPVWQSTTTMAQDLEAANIAGADGFSLNVSYFISTAENQTYGDALSKLVDNKHYVIDTSRNGGDQQVGGVVCNPLTASFGTSPTVNTGDPLNDALLWIKIPWESDGPCNGGPAPGDVFWSYAIQLAENDGW
ncbi:MAG TPA: glycoside hydrolase family 6 protein [Candidatus Binatia bacterium]|nr:glycoside hydrolase family 6 protein [Candidatus Binatia bacterium]